MLLEVLATADEGPGVVKARGEKGVLCLNRRWLRLTRGNHMVDDGYAFSSSGKEDQVNFEDSSSIHFMRAVRMASMPHRESYPE